MLLQRRGEKDGCFATNENQADVKQASGHSFGIGSQLLASNVPVGDVITYLGWDMCAVSPRDGLGPSLVKLVDLQEPRTYRRDDPVLRPRFDHGDGEPAGLGAESGTLLPAAFCWTRFGTESGMSVEQIIRRKEMERRASGLFVWGIGNALGAAIGDLCGRDADASALFSPMAGRAAAHDSAPDAVVAWRSYRDAIGSTSPLPPGVLVVSRASSATGGTKRYYGLFCSTTSPLALQPQTELEIGMLRNLTGTKWVGDQQTTAVVAVDPSGRPRRRYPVSLIARLVEPYYAEMLEPVPLSDMQVARTHEVAMSDDVDAWKATVAEILRRAPSPT